uniref:Uncharacterized protein n=1 Tax=Nothoprocta perdicaria TaxID=30464 RepID=A0A8C7EGQ5_NOTPE
MEEEDLSERGLPQIASIMSRVRDLKNKYKNEDNVTDELNYTKISADTTGIQRLHSLPGQPVPGLWHPHREEVLPHMQMELLVFQLILIAPCPVTGHH